VLCQGSRYSAACFASASEFASLLSVIYHGIISISSIVMMISSIVYSIDPIISYYD
jgi:hypothetical protein